MFEICSSSALLVAVATESVSRVELSCWVANLRIFFGPLNWYVRPLPDFNEIWPVERTFSKSEIDFPCFFCLWLPTSCILGFKFGNYTKCPTWSRILRSGFGNLGPKMRTLHVLFVLLFAFCVCFGFVCLFLCFVCCCFLWLPLFCICIKYLYNIIV